MAESGRRVATPGRLGGLALGAGLLLLAGLWVAHVAAAGRVAGLFHDEGVYIVAAESLAHADGYRAASLPEAPPERHYPPLLPLVLAAVWRLSPDFPANLPALKAVPLVAAGGIVLLLPVYLRRLGFTPLVALVTGILTAIAPLTLRYATGVVSELPFAFLALAALLATERAAEPGRPEGAAVLAGALAGLTLLTRVIGIAVVGAGVIALWRRVGWRHGLAFLLAAGLCVLPWIAWLATEPHAAGDPSYLAELSRAGWPHVHDVAMHAAQLPAAAALVALPGLADLIPTPAPAIVVGLFYAIGLVAIGLALYAPYGGYVAASLAIAVVWPLFQPRYVLPLAPFLLAPLLGIALTPAVGRVRRGIGRAVVAALAVAAVAGQGASLARVHHSGLPALEQVSDDSVTWDDVELALAWIRAYTQPDDVLGTVHDPLLYLYTGRSAVRAYPSLRRPDPSQVTAELATSGVRYLVDLPVPDVGLWAPARDAWERWLLDNASALEPVYSGAGGRIRVWRLQGFLPEITPTAAPPPRGHALG
jgi:hypothetical protein